MVPKLTSPSRRVRAWCRSRELVLACLLVLPAVSLSASQEAADSPAFRINVSVGGYPPYAMVAEDGSFGGILLELLQSALPEHRILISEFPRKRIDSFILGGVVDGTFRAPEWTSEPDRFIFSDPILEVRDVLLSPRQRPLRYEGPASIHDKKVLAHLGYSYPELEPAFASGQAERHDLRDERDMFRRLLSGERYDAVVMGERVAHWVIQQEGWDGHFVSYPIQSSKVGYRLMMAPANADTMALFNSRLEALQNSGDLERILQRYGGPAH